MEDFEVLRIWKEMVLVNYVVIRGWTCSYNKLNYLSVFLKTGASFLMEKSCF